MYMYMYNMCMHMRMVCMYSSQLIQLYVVSKSYILKTCTSTCMYYIYDHIANGGQGMMVC